MRLPLVSTFLLLSLVSVACGGAPADDAASSEANLDETASATFEACGDVLYAPDGKHIAYESCEAGVRLYDVATRTSKDLGALDQSARLTDAGDGKHVYGYAAGVLHVYGWDGSTKTFDDVQSFKLSPDGKRLVTYAQSRFDTGQYHNGYRLEVRVRDLDGGSLDVSGKYEEDRAGNFVNGDAAVSEVLFAPDGSRVSFIRKHHSSVTDAFFTDFDVATGAMKDGRHLGWATTLFPETYDGERVAFVEAALDGQRWFRFGTGAQDYKVAVAGTGAYPYSYCVTKAGDGVAFFTRASADGPFSLRTWDRTSGERNVIELSAESSPACPSATDSYAWFDVTPQTPRLAVVPLIADADPIYLPNDKRATVVAGSSELLMSQADTATIVQPESGTTDFSLAEGGQSLRAVSAIGDNRVVAFANHTRMEGARTFSQASIYVTNDEGFQPLAELPEIEGYASVEAHTLGEDRFAIQYGDLGGRRWRVTVYDTP